MEVTNDMPIEVDPLVVNARQLGHTETHTRILQEMATWNRKQRRAFVRKTGGFKKHGRKW